MEFGRFSRYLVTLGLLIGSLELGIAVANNSSRLFFPNQDYVMFMNTPNHTVYWWPEKGSDPKGAPPSLEVNRNHPFKVIKYLDSAGSKGDKIGQRWILAEPVYPIKGAPRLVLIPEAHVTKADPLHLSNVAKKIEGHIYDEVDWVAIERSKACKHCSKQLTDQVDDILAATRSAESQFNYSCETTIKGKKVMLSRAFGDSLKAANKGSAAGRAPAGYSDPQGFDNRFRPYCTYAILKQQHKHNRYNQCSKQGKRWYRKNRGLRPCITEDYHKAVHNTFTRVADCFGLPKKTLFSLYALESQFQINISSYSGAQGISQLTGQSEREMTKHIDRYHDTHWDTARRECGDVWQQFQTNFIGPGHPKRSCSRIAPPENPLQNLVLGAIHFIHNQNQILEEFLKWRKIPKSARVRQIEADIKTLDEGIKENKIAATTLQKLDKRHREKRAAIRDNIAYAKELKRMLADLRLREFSKSLYNRGSEDDIKIMQELMMYGHNFGQGDLVKYFEGYIERNPSAISFEEFSGSKGGFLTYLNDYLKGKSNARKFEMINYVHVLYPKRAGGGNSVKENDKALHKFQPSPEEKALAELNIDCGVYSK